MRNKLIGVVVLVLSLLIPVVAAPSAQANGPTPNLWAAVAPGDNCFYNQGTVGIGLAFSSTPINMYNLILPSHQYYCGTSAYNGWGHIRNYYVGPGFCSRYMRYKPLFWTLLSTVSTRSGNIFVDQGYDFGIWAYAC